MGTAPAFVAPIAAQAVKALPEGGEWLYEVEWDGYRALLIKYGKRVQLRSRNDKDLMRMYPTVAAAGLRLNAEQIVLDGEIEALGPDGHPSFQALQHRGSHAKHEIVFYAFDVLNLERAGPDCRPAHQATRAAAENHRVRPGYASIAGSDRQRD